MCKNGTNYDFYLPKYANHPKGPMYKSRPHPLMCGSMRAYLDLGSANNVDVEIWAHCHGKKLCPGLKALSYRQGQAWQNIDLQNWATFEAAYRAESKKMYPAGLENPLVADLRDEFPDEDPGCIGFRRLVKKIFNKLFK